MSVDAVANGEDAIQGHADFSQVLCQAIRHCVDGVAGAVENLAKGAPFWGEFARVELGVFAMKDGGLLPTERSSGDAVDERAEVVRVDEVRLDLGEDLG